MHIKFNTFVQGLFENLSIEADNARRMLMAGGYDNRELVKYIFMGSPEIKQELESKYKWLMTKLRVSFLENLFYLETVEFANQPDIPVEIFDLVSLSELRLRGTFEYIPKEIQQLQRLAHLYISSRDLKELPTEIGMLSDLTILDVTDTNNITEIPKEIGDLRKLKRLTVTSNAIEMLPIELKNCKNLQEVNLRNSTINNLSQIQKLLPNCRFQTKL